MEKFLSRAGLLFSAAIIAMLALSGCAAEGEPAEGESPSEGTGASQSNPQPRLVNSVKPQEGYLTVCSRVRWPRCYQGKSLWCDITDDGCGNCRCAYEP